MAHNHVTIVRGFSNILNLRVYVKAKQEAKPQNYLNKTYIDYIPFQRVGEVAEYFQFIV